jgi:hypothetical protein
VLFFDDLTAADLREQWVQVRVSQALLCSFTEAIMQTEVFIVEDFRSLSELWRNWVVLADGVANSKACLSL